MYSFCDAVIVRAELSLQNKERTSCPLLYEQEQKTSIEGSYGVPLKYSIHYYIMIHNSFPSHVSRTQGPGSLADVSSYSLLSSQPSEERDHLLPCLELVGAEGYACAKAVVGEVRGDEVVAIEELWLVGE